MNRLAHEKSPYLLQHAGNPVDWYPWGDEAFAKARAESLPIFLSIGYSTCHWCHVMERESFENQETARLLNTHFVPIKVDREERPDVDRLYMAYVQAATGSGGWPMSVWLTPDLEPFAGGTYYPPEDRSGHPGFPTLLRRIAGLWRTDRPRLLEHGARVVAMLREHAARQSVSAPVDPAIAEAAARQAAQMFDPEYGGFGSAPKFPRPVLLEFLLDYAEHSRQPGHAVGMVLHTLRAMAAGGICDQLGGGFHRYSVDRFWHVPHYEKMLYDQAQLAPLYVRAARLAPREEGALFADTARATLDYILRDLTSPGGAFFSAEDADSLPGAAATAKREGAFYTWTTAEIEAALGPAGAALFNRLYGVEPGGNSPPGSDPHGELAGANTLFLRLPPAEAARLASSRERLLAIRSRRPRPHLDDKIVAAWNGLAISAFARAASALDESRYLEAALRAAAFIRSTMTAPGGALLRSFRGGPGPAAFAEDYAALTRAALDLYHATGDFDWLQWAETLHARLEASFRDPASGAWFSSPQDSGLPLRMIEDHDGAEPAASSLAAANAIRLARLLDQPALEQRALQAAASFAPILQAMPIAMPIAMPAMLSAILRAAAPPRQLIVAGPLDLPATQALARVARTLGPDTLLYADAGPGQAWLASRIPAFASIPAQPPAAYLCENFTCQLPITDPEALADALREPSCPATRGI